MWMYHCGCMCGYVGTRTDSAMRGSIWILTIVEVAKLWSSCRLPWVLSKCGSYSECTGAACTTCCAHLSQQFVATLTCCVLRYSECVQDPCSMSLHRYTYIHTVPSLPDRLLFLHLSCTSLDSASHVDSMKSCKNRTGPWTNQRNIIKINCLFGLPPQHLQTKDSLTRPVLHSALKGITDSSPTTSRRLAPFWQPSWPTQKNGWSRWGQCLRDSWISMVITFYTYIYILYTYIYIYIKNPDEYTTFLCHTSWFKILQDEKHHF